jgi:hypothetical protein
MHPFCSALKITSKLIHATKAEFLGFVLMRSQNLNEAQK